MNFKTTLALLGLLLVVGAYFLFVEMRRDDADGRGRPASRDVVDDGQRLFDATAWRVEDVDRLTIERAGRSETLHRDRAGWRQVEPVRFPLRTEAVRELTQAVANMTSVDRFMPGRDDHPARAAVGLEPAQAVVHLHVKDARVASLHLGRQTLGGRAYVALNDDERVHVVDDALHRLVLEQRVAEWRERSLASPEATRLHRIAIARQDGSVEVVRDETRWFLDSHRVQRASVERVEALASAVANTRIQQFIADGPADMAAFGLQRPGLTLQLQLPDATVPGSGDTSATQVPGQVYTLRVGTAADMENQTFYATWSIGTEPSAVVFTLRRRDVEAISLSADDLRDRRVVLTQASQVREMVVEREGRPLLHLVRDTNRGFVFGEPNPGYAVDYHEANQLLEHLTAIEAQGFADAAPTGTPLATLRLMRVGTRAVERVDVYPAAAHQTPDGPVPMYELVRADEPVVYRVAAEQVGPVLAPPIVLRDRQLLDVPAARIAGVLLAGSAVVMDYEFVRESSTQGQGAWRLTGHERFEREAFDRLLTRLRQLRAAQWLDAPVELSSDAITVTLQLTDGTSHELRIDPATHNARLHGSDEAFAVESGLVNMVMQEYRDRTVLPIGVARMESVRISDGDEATTIRRSATGQYTVDSGEQIDQAAAGSLFDTLAGLRVQRHVDEKPAEQLPISFAIRMTDGDEVHLRVPRVKRGDRADQVVLTLVGRLDGRDIDMAFTLEPALLERFTATDGE